MVFNLIVKVEYSIEIPNEVENIETQTYIIYNKESVDLKVIEILSSWLSKLTGLNTNNILDDIISPNENYKLPNKTAFNYRFIVELIELHLKHLDVIDGYIRNFKLSFPMPGSTNKFYNVPDEGL
jgi:hypothetical protein